MKIKDIKPGGWVRFTSNDGIESTAPAFVAAKPAAMQPIFVAFSTSPSNAIVCANAALKIEAQPYVSLTSVFNEGVIFT